MIIQVIRHDLAETKRLLTFASYIGIKRRPFETNASFRDRLISEHRSNKGNILSFARFMFNKDN